MVEMNVSETPVRVLDITPNSILLLEGRTRTRLIPANTFNTLKYVIKGSFEGMVGQSHTKIKLSENCLISPTTQEYVFCLEYDGRAIHTTPDSDSRVCEAIMKAYTEKDFGPFKTLFNDLYEKKVTREFVSLFIMALGERVRPAVINGLPGYTVDEDYFVAENASAYKIVRREDGSRSIDLKFLCIVPKNHQIKPAHFKYNGTRVVLGQQEQIFFSKIMMLLNREKHMDDQTFWRQVQRQ